MAGKQVSLDGQALPTYFLPWPAAGTKDDEPPAAGIEVAGPVTLDE